VRHRRRQLLNRNGEQDMVSFSSFLLLLLYFFCWLYASLADRFFTGAHRARHLGQFMFLFFHCVLQMQNLRTTSLLYSGLEPSSPSKTSPFDILFTNNNNSSNSNLNLLVMYSPLHTHRPPTLVLGLSQAQWAQIKAEYIQWQCVSTWKRE